MSTPTAHDAALVVALLDNQQRYLSHRIPENRAHDKDTAKEQIARTAAYRRIAADLRQRFGLEAHG